MPPPDPAVPDPDHLLAELADLVMNVGRLVRARTPADAEAVPLTETERAVMRLVDLFPGSSPSEISARARLQRTNVSAALRSLETKGMVTRSASSGRGVAVTATALAGRNLEQLRAAWAASLRPALGDDEDAVRRGVDLLARLEARLVDDGEG
ncbi:MarR family winged helix-turn-helix transcriptional regulator [Nocardioides zeae]|uniref:MarR family winged helix-turn-helix transcriptional regulator n=1 Tax=Nocardioides imazamoxiresistens TaxID=3231893 RepID=A0ABU3PSE0_9ACTN|nr:MarR family winged helix-turn-helix transcriptional regulator [Nocardioides zeae]MDT9592106.1 MarR family winged helix-turn-helix transcriptional regulator [Nocardioides zeae]